MYKSLTNARQEAERTTKDYVDEIMDKYNIEEWSDYTGISAINSAEDDLAHALMNYSEDSEEIKEAEEELKNVIDSYGKSLQDDE